MELIELRYTMAMERMQEIPGENAVDPLFTDYFEEGAKWFLLMREHGEFLASEQSRSVAVDVLKERNRQLYEEILPESYGRSYANHDHARELFGAEYGPVLASLRYEMRSAIPFVYRKEKERFLIRAELFLEVYTAFTVAFAESGGRPESGHVRHIIYQYLADYAEDEMLCYLSDRLVEGSSDITSMVMDENSGVRDLFLTGEYVTDDEIVSAQYIGSLSEEKISLIAGTITEGYRRGFINGGKNLASKKSASVIFHLGFERVLRKCAMNLREMGLRVIIPSEVPTLFHKYSNSDMGYGGADPNPQYYYDHADDLAIYLDKSLQTRRTEALSNAYKAIRSRTLSYAGPVVIEVFGRKPFEPSDSAAAPSYDKHQRAMCTEYEIKASALYSDAVDALNRCFTVIAFPMPAIADRREEYEEIFDAVVGINTLDNALYEEVQGKMIDVLCTASHVEVKGMKGNRTSLKIKLTEPADPENEANFENCTADVNIPVGEVFTTPVLEGTDGKLHVRGVHLGGFYFKDLEIVFKDGRVRKYSCANFEDEESGLKYIEDNILHSHKNLPMGECAIGTNTTAYAAAVRYGISDRLPILIAEKTGPHFAVGDTCYSHEEENHIYNPDGKEIIAKDNSVSILRKTDAGKAYFGCHTDITIPYEELGEFTAVRKDGTRIPILMEGRFVLDGTQILNGPLDGAGNM